MEEILANLLVPNNDTIIKATEALHAALKSPEGIGSLCNVLTSSQSPQVRQYAAVVLRKRLTKLRNWKKIAPETQACVKAAILPVLVREQEKVVKKAVAQLIAAIAKHELPGGGWPELPSLLQGLMGSSTQSDVDLAMFSMSVLTDVALDAFAPQADQFVFLFTTTAAALDDLTTVLGYYTVVTMTNVLPFCEANANLRNVYSKSIPRIVNAVPGLALADEERACDVLDFFCEILTSAIPLIVPHMAQLVQLCLGVAGNKALGPTIRDKAMLILGMCARVKKKLLVKLQLVKPMVEGLFMVMCEPPEGGAEGDEEEEEWFSGEDNESPFQSATSVLGSLAIFLPPNQLLDNIVRLVTVGLQESSPHIQKACYLALATVTEGASECLRNKYLPFFLECVCAGITNSCATVRNAALFALGQLSEHLQPEISEHADKLMPILFQYLSHLCNRLSKGSAEPPGLYSMFYALVAFCENMEEKLVPYLPELMQRLVEMLEARNPVPVQEEALDAIGSVASAVRAAVLPYLPTILQKLNMYLLQQHTEDTVCLQVQALRTLALIAETLGSEHFAPSLAEESVNIGLKLLQGSEDPDLKSAIYSLFAALSSVLKEQSSVFLPALVESIFLSIKSTEGFVPHYKDEENGGFPVYEDLSDTADEEDIGEENEEEDSDEEPVELTVENPYMEEKEEACTALKDFASHAGRSFFPYLETSYKTVFDLTSYTYDDVRQASFGAVAHFCVAFSKLHPPSPALREVLAEFVPKCCETIGKDEESLVVNAAMEALATLLKEIGAPVLQEPSHLDLILKAITDVLSSQTGCQDKEEEETEEAEAEQDELLMESAGEVIPLLGKALSPPQFLLCLQNLLKIIVSKLVRQGSVSQRSFFIGTLAECMEPAGPELEARPDLALQLLKLYLSLAQDPHHDVRNNAIFGLGELFLHAKQALYSEYMSVLLVLSNALGNESSDGVVDNICGALARLITTNSSLVPIDQVLPVLLGKLPLRQDYAEHAAVIKCLASLYQLGDPTLSSHISTLIRVCCLIVNDKLGNEEVLGMGVELLKRCRGDFPEELDAVLRSLPPSSTLANLLT